MNKPKTIIEAIKRLDGDFDNEEGLQNLYDLLSRKGFREKNKVIRLPQYPGDDYFGNKKYNFKKFLSFWAEIYLIDGSFYLNIEKDINFSISYRKKNYSLITSSMQECWEFFENFISSRWFEFNINSIHFKRALGFTCSDKDLDEIIKVLQNYLINQ